MNVSGRYRFVSGFQSGILKISIHASESYIVIVAGKDEFLQRPNVFFQEVQPLLFVLNLIHMNIAGWHVLVTTR